MKENEHKHIEDFILGLGGGAFVSGKNLHLHLLKEMEL